MKKHIFLFSAAIISAISAISTVAAQTTFDYSDIAAGKFAQKTVSGVRSMADGEHYTVNTGVRIEKYSYRTGRLVEVIVESQADIGDYEFSRDERKVLIAFELQPIYRHSKVGRYSILDLDTRELKRLTEHGGERDAAFSPDGKTVAFVRDNDIYCVDLATQTMSRVTRDGEKNRIINGHTDWVYEEEFGFTRAFDFSPDGQQIAYLKFDESEVPQAAIMRFDGLANSKGTHPEISQFKYPMAGERNSKVELHVYDMASGRDRRVDIGDEAEYVPHIGWTPAGKLYFYRENRLQNHFEVVVDGEGVLYEERDDRYVELPDAETVTFLDDGRFVVMNESSGWRHLYLYDARGRLKNAVTGGNWEVTKLLGVVGNTVYYLSNEGSPLRNNLWSVRLDGTKKRRLTHNEGTYSIAPSEGFRYFIRYFSNAKTPLQVDLCRGDGSLVRSLVSNPVHDIPVREFTTVNGLNAWVLKPSDFDPAKKYPLLMFQYSGPGSQEVKDQWKMEWYDVLAQNGYVVACVDGRGTGGRGAEFRKCTHLQLGKLETRDQISAARYFASLPWVDAGRIGIYGWSFGGFMTLNCMLHGADVFKAGIAVAPVTSWRFYDTVYTEIYNGLPQENPEGYDDNSPLSHAEKLAGKLLLVHGTADDNVHIQHAYLMAEAFTAAGRPFEMRIYPDANHSMMPHNRHDVRTMMVEWVMDNL